MNDIMKTESFSVISNIDGELKPHKVKDLLLDRRTLLQNELRSLLECDIEYAQPQRISELISLLLSDFEYNGHNLRENSLKSLCQHWDVFRRWCGEHNIVHIPCSVDNFERFIIELAPTVKHNTLKVYSWAVQTYHLAAGLPSPTEPLKIKHLMGKMEEVKLNNGEFIGQAAAFNLKHLEVLKQAYSKSERLIERRDLALLMTAYESMLRESELARVSFEHLNVAYDGRGILLIPITKTRHSGEPDKVILSHECMAAINDYVALANLERKGLIFKRVHKSNKIGEQIKPLSGYAIDSIFSNAFKFVKTHSPHLLRSEQVWSGHSARVGACQDLLAAGFSPMQVQVSGRWSSLVMVYRYGRDILAEDGAMAKFRQKSNPL
ncbi:tyrosine-type recombinase/integrase [Shewanella xiamenensis]|uniref:tyrosine-type recombinase/integrase n=1 Tax=Shewanella TaxID=22 RepID=UPI00217DDB3C|nr:tyrosine-type recombinase/integrase [Shewanella xiamenensis]MCT8869327.1 tyrosine-type recombinase/integrase [Shewanella xiamenensis]MCT8873830.1 tyrosine-type recombinase/integrase [Shewanella xiamenensis]MCT8877490.1 tyrosine-type recombinase/integrase [Shewanella xiamenensis]UWH39932.1 tyrosine-type recombinase/integrase [Shewanella xiamenensis]